MSALGGYGVPGSGAISETNERNLIWGGDSAKGMVLTQSGKYSSAILDAGNSPTTNLRPGLLVGKLDSGGELVEWDASEAAAGALGAQNIFGVNPLDFRSLDFDATAVDRVLPVIVRAPLKAKELLIQGSALVGHTDEFLARRQLWGMGCILDDDTNGQKAGAQTRYIEKITDYTVVAADNGTVFTSTTADTNYTLPTLAAGLEFEFVQTADFELAVTSAAGDDIIGGNDVAGDSITFTTASEQIGARVKFKSVYVGTTLKWLYEQKIVNFSTDNVLAFTFAT